LRSCELLYFVIAHTKNNLLFYYQAHQVNVQTFYYPVIKCTKLMANMFPYEQILPVAVRQTSILYRSVPKQCINFGDAWLFARPQLISVKDSSAVWATGLFGDGGRKCFIRK